MSRYVIPVDISNMPDLLELVEEVEATNSPCELRRDNQPVAVLIPITEDKGLHASRSQRSETTGEALLRLATLGEKLRVKAPPDLSSRIDDYLYGEE